MRQKGYLARRNWGEGGLVQPNVVRENVGGGVGGVQSFACIGDWVWGDAEGAALESHRRFAVEP
jgi:hypothetical protein